MISNYKDKPEFKIVARISTSYWSDNKGLYQRKNIAFQRRKSTLYGLTFIYDDISNASPDEVADSIVNLNECKDGLYTLELCNVSYDHCEGYATGYMDSWNYKLVPCEE